MQFGNRHLFIRGQTTHSGIGSCSFKDRLLFFRGQAHAGCLSPPLYIKWLLKMRNEGKTKEWRESGGSGLWVQVLRTPSPGYSDSIGLVLSLYCFLIMCIPNQGIWVSLKRIISAPIWSRRTPRKLKNCICLHNPHKTLIINRLRVWRQIVCLHRTS